MLSRRTAVLVLSLSLAGFACSSSTDYGSGGGGGGNPPAADVHAVAGASGKTTTAFNPNPFTVALNGGPSVTVKWGNSDNTAHHVQQDGASPSFSGALAVGGTYSFAFTAPGTYNYHCTIHPNMVGSIVVNP
jgi:plastocyanin